MGNSMGPGCIPWTSELRRQTVLKVPVPKSLKKWPSSPGATPKLVPCPELSAFAVVQNSSNGNCFFEAMSYLLPCHEDAKIVRNSLARWAFSDSRATVADVRRLATDACWTTAPDIALAARFWGKIFPSGLAVWLAEQRHWLHFDVTGGCAQVGLDDLPVHEDRFYIGCGWLRFSAGHFEAMRLNATTKSRDCMDMAADMGAGPVQRDRGTERRGARWADMEDSDPGEDTSVDSFDLARPLEGQGPTVLERMNFEELLSSRQTRAAALRACMAAFKIELCEMVAQCEQLVVEDEGWKMFMLDPCCRELPMPFYLLQVFVAKLQMGSLMVVDFHCKQQIIVRGSGLATRTDARAWICWNSETKRFFAPTDQSGMYMTLPYGLAGQRSSLLCGLHSNAVRAFAFGPTVRMEESDIIFWNLDTTRLECVDFLQTLERAGILRLAPCLRKRSKPLTWRGLQQLCLALPIEHHAGLVVSSGPRLCHVTFNAIQPATLDMVVDLLRAGAIGLWVDPSWRYCHRLMFAIDGVGMVGSAPRAAGSVVSNFSVLLDYWLVGGASPTDGASRQCEVALLVHPKWCRAILEGGKVWEIRGQKTAKRERIAIAEKGTGHLVGEVTLVDCLQVGQRQSDGSWEAWGEADNYLWADRNRPKHAIEDPATVPYRKAYAWVLDNPVKYVKPVPYHHKKGCQTWVKLESEPGTPTAEAGAPGVPPTVKDTEVPSTPTLPGTHTSVAPLLTTGRLKNSRSKRVYTRGCSYAERLCLHESYGLRASRGSKPPAAASWPATPEGQRGSGVSVNMH